MFSLIFFINFCEKRDLLNLGPIRLCKLLTISSFKIVWYTLLREA